jgi:hypothetical protein
MTYFSFWRRICSMSTLEQRLRQNNELQEHFMKPGVALDIRGEDLCMLPEVAQECYEQYVSSFLL